MTTEADLRAAIAAAAAHIRPGGAAIFMPDAVTETFAPGAEHGGRDGVGGRGLRFLGWTHELNADGVTYDVDYVLLIHEPGRPIRLEQDRHTMGLFPRATWRSLIEGSGLEPIGVSIEDSGADQVILIVSLRGGPPSRISVIRRGCAIGSGHLFGVHQGLSGHDRRCRKQWRIRGPGGKARVPFVVAGAMPRSAGS